MCSSCTTSSRPRPGRRRRWKRSWCGPPTGWWAGQMRCWWWTTPRWSSRVGTRWASSASIAASSASGPTASPWSRSRLLAPRCRSASACGCSCPRTGALIQRDAPWWLCPGAIGYQPKWQIGLDEIDRVLASGARFGCVLADAEYGKAAEFRAGLAARRLLYAVSILPTQKVYPADVTLSRPERKATGRPRKHPVPSVASTSTAELLEARPELFRSISWRIGTKGPLQARFAALRVRVADGPVVARAQHLPGEEAWLVGEHRTTGERKYYLTNHPADAPLEVLAALIKARWICEQMHQQLKEELGLDHFEGRSWRGLHHHVLLCQLAFAFLQHLRLGGKKRRDPTRARAATRAEPARHPAPHRGGPCPHPAALSPLPAALR